MRSTQLGIVTIGVALILELASIAHADPPCIAFVHGHRADSTATTDYTYNEGQSGTAVSYWQNSREFIRDATNNYDVRYSVVQYNTHKYYYDAAAELTDDLYDRACKSATGSQLYGSWLVTHSMGGRMLSWIMGNSVSGDPYYNYGGKRYDLIRAKYDLWWSMGGGHDGTEAAEAVCGYSTWSCELIEGIVDIFTISECDLGTKSMMHSWSPQWENGTRVVSRLISGYEAMGTSGCLNGEDDGIIEYASSYFCNNHPDDDNSVGYDRFCSSLEDVNTGGLDGCGDDPVNKCQTDRKQRSGYYNYDAGHENHDDQRESDDPDPRRAVAGGYWQSHNCHPIEGSCDYDWGTCADPDKTTSGEEIGWFLTGQTSRSYCW